MSEYQVVAFRAIDAPVSKQNLEFMRKQSTRAEITSRSFDNEYHFGDFHGNTEEMLRRGYDFHLHYADFGTRKLMLRLTNGLPESLKPYFKDKVLGLVEDKQGAGVIVCLEYSHEPGELEDIYDLDEMIEDLLPIRQEMLEGDPRGLYLAHLAVASGEYHDPEKIMEAPVPAGLDSLSSAQLALADFLGLSLFLIKIAAQKSPPLPGSGKKTTDSIQYKRWLESIPEKTKTEWLLQILNEETSPAVRGKMMAQYRQAMGTLTWPTVPGTRKVIELIDAEREMREAEQRRKKEKEQWERQEQLKKLADDPEATLEEVDRLVAEKKSPAYQTAVKLLLDLREAVLGTVHEGIVEAHAALLKTKYRQSTALHRALKKQGLIEK